MSENTPAAEAASGAAPAAVTDAPEFNPEAGIAGAAVFASAESVEILNLLGEAESGAACCGGSCCSA